MFIIKILLGGLHQEINSFSPGKTGVEEYKRKQFCLGQDMIDFGKSYVRCNEGADELGAAYNELIKAGATVVPGGFVSAQPGAIIEQSVVDDYIEHIKKATRDNMPIDGVVLVMHGAAQSEKSDDPEGDIIVAVREIVGPDVPICVGLDFHANVSERMVKNSNTISLYQKYPE